MMNSSRARSKVSLPFRSVAAVRGCSKEDNEEVLRILAKLCPEEPLKGGSYVNKGLYRRYRQEWLRVNTAISRDYLDGEPLFQREIPLPDDVEFHKIDGYRLAAYIQNMYRIFGNGAYSKYRDVFTRATVLAMAEQNLWHALDKADKEVLLSWI